MKFGVVTISGELDGFGLVEATPGRAELAVVPDLQLHLRAEQSEQLPLGQLQIVP
jgi:hypothetical protein